MDREKKDNKAAVGGAVVDEKGKMGSEPQKAVSSDLLIVDKHYELTKWYAQAIAKFSRDRRRVLGDRLERNLYDMLENMIEARYKKDKLSLLYGLNVKLDVLRLETRLAKDLSALSSRQHLHVSGLIDEVGRLLGGWIKQQQRR